MQGLGVKKCQVNISTTDRLQLHHYSYHLHLGGIDILRNAYFNSGLWFFSGIFLVVNQYLMYHFYTTKF
jgi:hypothetical protein